MKILFVENRYKTYFWQQLASALAAMGHTVECVVQNHCFQLTEFHCWVIPYPKKSDLLNCNDDFNFIKNSDRLVNYFSAGCDHYLYYFKKIKQVVESVKPDLVIGESTLFHELLMIQVCREEKIRYLHPSSSSYPKGHFSLYQYDKKEAYGGADELVSDVWCDELISAIVERKIQPDYMLSSLNKAIKSEIKKYPKPGSWQDRWTILRAYFTGERYNTPHPWRKFLQDRRLRNLKTEWSGLAAQRAGMLVDKKRVLYPLQMQPEANLDVWGQQYRDQAELLQRLAEALPSDVCLLVKANPKVKYELNEKLLGVVVQYPNIIPLNLHVTMDSIFQSANLIVTVTGTIAIEAVLSEKPLLLLGASVVEGFSGVASVSPEEVGVVLEKSEKGCFSVADQDQKRAVIRRLLSSSYAGLISDPCHAIECLDKKNIQKIATILHEVMKVE